MTQKIVLSRSEQHRNFSFSTSAPRRIRNLFKELTVFSPCIGREPKN